MKINEIRIGQSVRHPDHDGTGDVTRIEPEQVEVFFNDGKRNLNKAECERLIPVGLIDTSHVYLAELIQKTVLETLEAHKEQSTSVEFANKWNKGKILLQPGDSSLASKEVELETFFHKIVMVRDNLRVLEQKINAHKTLTEEEKVEMQQYITRMAGSLTTFNVLFKHKEDQF